MGTDVQLQVQQQTVAAIMASSASSSSASPGGVASAVAGGTQAAPPRPPLFQRQSSTTSSSRRSSTGVHRSPSLLAQQEPSNMPQRFTRSKSSDEQSRLINALEAEEEALVNSLSRKLEKLRAEKVELESTLEMEQEQLVNRLQRQLSQLLASQNQQQQGLTPATASSSTAPTSLPSSPGVNELPLDALSNLGHYSSSPIPRSDLTPLLSTSDPSHPPPTIVLEALQTENNSLRNRLADASKMSEMYRQELIDLRARAGIDIADLVNAGNSSLGNNYEGYSSAMGAGQGDSTSSANRSRRDRDNVGRPGGGGLPSNITNGSSIRIPGVSNSPPLAFRHSRSVSFSKSSYSPSPSITSALVSPSTPFSSASPATNTTTPSTSYSTPLAPNSTPISNFVSLPSSASSSLSSTPYGSVPSSGIGGSGGNSTYTVPPPSLASSLGGDSLLLSSHPPPHMLSAHSLSTSPVGETTMIYPGNSLQRRLSNSRHGARVAETGILKRRSSSVNRNNGSSGISEDSSEPATPGVGVESAAAAAATPSVDTTIEQVVEEESREG